MTIFNKILVSTCFMLVCSYCIELFNSDENLFSDILAILSLTMTGFNFICF